MPDMSSGPSRSGPNGADAYRLFHFFPALPVPGDLERSWILLGEEDKIVPVSPHRFVAVGVNMAALNRSCLNMLVSGSIQENVSIGAISPHGRYVQEVFTLNKKTATVALCA